MGVRAMEIRVAFVSKKWLELYIRTPLWPKEKQPQARSRSPGAMTWDSQREAGRTTTNLTTHLVTQVKRDGERRLIVYVA